MKQPETAVHTVAAFEKAAIKKLGTRTSRALPEGTQGADKAGQGYRKAVIGQL